MNDLAFALLQQRINNNVLAAKQCLPSKQCLWVVDENIDENGIATISPWSGLHVICNRFDVWRVLQKHGFNAVLSDFDFSDFNGLKFDCIYYRVSKEKAIVHHIINCCGAYLKNGGMLLLSGYKNEGIKTYIDKAGRFLGHGIERERGGRTSLLAVIEKQGNEPCKPLDDRDYTRLRVINPNDALPLVSKPGLFGWNKIDRGSAYLVEHLPEFLRTLASPAERVVDLGCGYGYLSVMLSQLLDAQIIATDNNVAAVTACEENFQHYAISGKVLLADCADGVNGRVDAVICNPPFHQGFSVEGELTRKFLIACKRLLKKTGRALFVVNSFIALERSATDVFSEVAVIDNNKRFKLVALTK